MCVVLEGERGKLDGLITRGGPKCKRNKKDRGGGRGGGEGFLWYEKVEGGVFNMCLVKILNSLSGAEKNAG